MKQEFLLKGLDCPHCGAKIEQEVGALEGVSAASLNLMKQTLRVETTDAALLQKVETIVHSHEPDVEVSALTHTHDHHHHHHHGHGEAKTMILRLVLGAGLFALAFALKASLPLLIAAYAVLGADVVWRAARNIVRGQVFDENFLMSLASIGAFFIGEAHEAVAVMLFYQLGEFFQGMAVQRSRRSIAALMDIRPDTATVLRGGEWTAAASESVAVGETILVKPGERIPLDGVVELGTSLLDTSALTGESMPRSVTVGDEVLSGCINQSGTLHVRVTKPYSESTAAKIIDLVENAAERKAPAEHFITTFARYYTPAVVILAAALALVPPLFVGGWADWIHRGFVFLVVSCPCALVISVPLAFFGGIGAASRHGVLVKGGNYLEALGKVRTLVFDKTGTLTRGVFAVTQLLPAKGFTDEQLLSLAAAAESRSTHPIARSILERCPSHAEADCREIAGEGVEAAVEGKTILAGSAKLMERFAVPYTPCASDGTKVYVAEDGVFAGCIVIADEIKPDSKRAIAALKALGIEKTVMLTGDSVQTAAAVSAALGIDEYRAELLPDGKVAAIENLGGTLAFVGDGINDAPVLARADVGIAMGALGSDAAIEAADVVLMTDEVGKIAEAIELAHATKRIVRQNIVFSLTVKALFLLLGALGKAGMWAAVFGDVGVAMLAVLNSMRLLKK